VRQAGVEPLAPLGADPEIRGACLDSRRVEAGDLFFALRGLQHDGETFVDEALRRGARAVVAESARPASLPAGAAWVRVADARRAAGPLSRELWGRPDEALSLVGVTGTNGKTTVTYLVEAIASAAGLRAGRIGTVSQSYDGTEREALRTTPEAPDLYRLLSDMHAAGVALAVMEVSSHALALGRVEGARFAAAAFLNLSRDHQDFHPDVQAYFDAKARLFEGLDAGRPAILPADSSHGAELRRRTRGRVLTFGRAPQADVRLRDEHSVLSGSSATLDTPGGAIPVRTHLAGRFNLDNVAAAAACALALGLPADAITTGVASVGRVPGRMERIERGQPFAVIVDYAHTDQALSSLLGWLRPLVTARLLLVFGCGGDRDRGKRFMMGRAAAAGADRVFLTSDNPRSEEPDAILRAVAAGVAAVDGGAARCESIVEREAAIRRAIAAARAGDVVVIAGKGHETTQTVGDRVRPFDDRRVAAETLAELGWCEESRAGA
jgi:UDP-N-acetylmuramoyl-L-alanyl-D-glutamate--2,6-diaminopimelate ligase